MARMPLLWLALAGCPKTTVIGAPDYAALPRLPSPSAGTYALAPQAPPDPVIKALLKGQTWDASLSGAAAGIGLSAANDRGGLARWQVREAAWKAGWPYPIQDVFAWATEEGGSPPTDMLTWVSTLQPATQVGLVRARGKGKDVWVGLGSTPRADVGVQPRQLPEGAQLVLPRVPGATYTISDPRGRLQQGHLEIARTLTVEEPGEWVVEIADAGGAIALFPVYVGLVPPDVGLFAEARRDGGDASVEVQAETLLSEIRRVYGLRPWTRDPLLDAAARSGLNDATQDTQALSARFGFEPGELSRWECRGASIEACLDGVLWAPRARPALLGDTDLLGMATSFDGHTVHLVALIGPS